MTSRTSGILTGYCRRTRERRLTRPRTLTILQLREWLIRTRMRRRGQLSLFSGWRSFAISLKNWEIYFTGRTPTWLSCFWSCWLFYSCLWPSCLWDSYWVVQWRISSIRAKIGRSGEQPTIRKCAKLRCKTSFSESRIPLVNYSDSWDKICKSIPNSDFNKA